MGHWERLTLTLSPALNGARRPPPPRGLTFAAGRAEDFTLPLDPGLERIISPAHSPGKKLRAERGDSLEAPRQLRWSSVAVSGDIPGVRI